MDIRNGKIYAMMFILFIVCLIVGGYILTVIILKDTKVEEPKTNTKIEVNDKLKVDKDKEYIYYDFEEVVSEKENIVFNNIFININSDDAEMVMNRLNNQNNSNKTSLKKISEQNISDEDLQKFIYKEDDIYSISYSKYTRYFYKNYASIISDDYKFDCFNGHSYLGSKAYTFDTLTGKIVSYQNLLKEFNLDMEKVKSKIKEKLERKLEDTDKEILITETINDLNEDNYAIYIDKSGFLTISYLVKCTELNYNDVIIFN